MTNTAKVLPVISGDTSLPQLDFNALPASARAFEFRFNNDLAQFCFDQSGGQVPLSDRTPGSQFVLDDAGKNYSLQSNTAGQYIQIAAGAQNGLITEQEDVRVMTFGGVFNYRGPTPGTARTVLMGTAPDLGTHSNGGTVLEVRPDGAIGGYVNGYEAGAGSWSLTQDSLEAAGIVRGNNRFVFVVMSSEVTEGIVTRTWLRARGAADFVSAQRTGTKNLSTASNKLSIGNAYMSGVFDEASTRCALAFAGNAFYSKAQLEELYQRCKIIASRRGVTVF